MDDDAQDGIERGVQMLAEVFGEEAQDQTAVLPEQRVLAPVAAVGGATSVGQPAKALAGNRMV